MVCCLPSLFSSCIGCDIAIGSLYVILCSPYIYCRVCNVILQYIMNIFNYSSCKYIDVLYFYIKGNPPPPPPTPQLRGPPRRLLRRPVQAVQQPVISRIYEQSQKENLSVLKASICKLFISVW